MARGEVAQAPNDEVDEEAEDLFRNLEDEEPPPVGRKFSCGSAIPPMLH